MTNWKTYRMAQNPLLDCQKYSEVLWGLPELLRSDPATTRNDPASNVPQAVPSAVDAFLQRYLPLWNGKTNDSTIIGLIAHTAPLDWRGSPTHSLNHASRANVLQALTKTSSSLQRPR